MLYRPLWRFCNVATVRRECSKPLRQRTENKGGFIMWYRAEYEDENIEMILADDDNQALEIALDNETEFGTLFNLFLLDENDNEIATIF